MTTARQRRGNSNGEPNPAATAPSWTTRTSILRVADALVAAWALPSTSTSFSTPSSSSAFSEGIRAGQMQPVETETTAEAFD